MVSSFRGLIGSLSHKQKGIYLQPWSHRDFTKVYYVYVEQVWPELETSDKIDRETDRQILPFMYEVH